MGFFDRDTGGVTELRVHGVSGTPPEAMLCHPHVQRVAGDGTTGFYRRLWEARQTSADRDGRRLEAYSWGGLTSGGWSRALWLLLLPFMLLNVAFFMTPFPYLPDDGAQGSERKRRLVASAISRGSMPLSSAARWILRPCSSVPVRKRTSSPSRRCQRAMASAMIVV